MPKYCCPNLHRSATIFHSWNQAFRIMGFLGRSPNINPAWCWEQSEGRLSWPYYVFPPIRRPGFMIITPYFSHFSVVFSNQRFGNCSPTVNVGFVKLPSDFFFNRVLKMSIEFCCHLCCNSTVIFRHSPLQCTLSFGFRPLFFLADYVFHWSVYAVITLETAALDTPNKVAVLIIYAPAKRTPTISPLLKSDKSPILQCFHTNCY